MYLHRVLSLLLLVCCTTVVWAQSFTISGKVTDAATGEPLPYTSVFIEGRFTGTMTDDNGLYQLQVGKRADSLGAQALGYKTLVLPIAGSVDQTIDFALQVDATNLEMVIVEAGENPADILLKKVIDNKPRLNIYQFSSVSYEAYTKYEIDLLDFTKENIDENKLLKRFPHLKDYVDSTQEGNSILPAFFIENLSDIYLQRDPAKQQEVIKAIKISGVEKQDLLTNLLGNVNQNLNIYDNLMAVMGKNFVSPVADYALGVYRYTLMINDTLYIDGEPHLEMTFKPRRKGENTFTGTMLINVNAPAVKRIDMRLADDVNIGFIESLDFAQQFQQHVQDADTFWVPTKEQLQLKFTYYLGGDTRILGIKNKSNQNYRINEPIAGENFNAFERTLIADDAYEQTDSFWTSTRHDTLGLSEAGIYEMVDSLKRTRKFKTIYYSLQTLSSGYARVGRYIELGHIASVFSLNDVERVRLRLGFRTSRKFSERIRFQGYGAYGFRDNRFKYGGGVEFIISKRPWHKISAFARTDIDLQSRHAEELDQDNVFSLLSKPRVVQRLYNIEEYKLVYDTELHNDLILYLSTMYQQFFPYFNFSYVDAEGDTRADINNTQFGARLRWQYRSKGLPGVFDREAKANQFFAQFRKKNEWPVFSLVYNLGVPNVINSDFLYHDMGLNVQGDVTLTAKMSWYYNFWIGKIFNPVPYLLLKNPEGNFTYVHNKYFFNNMDLLEFTADEYMSLNFQWFLGGMLADKIPLVKKLGLRGVAGANVFWGNLSAENKLLNQNNPIDIAYPIPYVEASFGIENILKFIRIDYVQRITHLDKPRVTKWAIYASLFIKV